MKLSTIFTHTILFIFLVATCFTIHGKSRNTFETPDFNFPQTVIENANEQLAKALKSGNGETVALAIIQSSLAKSMISNDSLPNIISNIDSVIRIEKNNNIKSILSLLEAKILNEYYNDNRFKLSQRLSNNSSIENINEIPEWNTQQFKTKISTLLDSALACNTLVKTPVTSYPKLILINNISIPTYPTLYDFIAYQAIEIYKNLNYTYWNPLRENNTSNNDSFSKKIIFLYDEIIATHHSNAPRITAMLNKMEYTKTNTLEHLDSLYQQYKNSIDAAPIVLELVKKDSDKRKNYYLLNSFLKRFPDNNYSALLTMQLIDIASPSVRIDYNRQYLSVDSISIECIINNANNFNIDIYALDDSIKNIYTHDFSTSQPILSQAISLKNEVPFNDKISVSFPPLPYGRYTAIVNLTDRNENSLRLERINPEIFIVSDIVSFSIINNDDKTKRIFAVNGKTGKPSKNVTISSTTQGRYPKKYSQKTNSKGFANIDSDSFNSFSFTKNEDKYYSANFYFYPQNYKKDNTLKFAQVFTDLAIYRPGETMHMAAVCYTTNHTKELMSNKEVEVTLIDASYEKIDSIKLITDKHGRITHDFILPTDCMNGEFHITIKENGRNISDDIITISEYKSPTFLIEFTNPQHTYSENSKINISGVAKTFSDIPIAGVTVECTLSSSTFYSFNELANFVTTTNEQGEFTITLDAEELKSNEKNPFCTYKISAKITDNAGDTQSQNTYFYIGKSFSLIWNKNISSKLSFNANNAVTLPITISSNEADSKSNIPCTLLLRNINSHSESTFYFNSSNPSFNFSGLKSGEYILSAWVNEDTTTKIKDTPIVIYRNNDKQSPVSSALWTPNTNLECIAGESFNILLGSAINNNNIYFTINYKNQILKEGWKKLSKGVSNFKYTMPKDAESNIIIELYCVKNLELFFYRITVTPKTAPVTTELRVESFRDKITAGDTEKWTLHFDKNGEPVDNGAIIASLTDKAINQLSDNIWHFNPITRTGFTMFSMNIDYDFMQTDKKTFLWRTNKYGPTPVLNFESTITVPQLNLYDQSFFASRVLGYRNIMYSKASTAVETGFGDQAVNDEISTENNNNNDITQIRTTHIKTAFWQPNLVTDSIGNAHIEFVVPNYNTTWLLQTVGYDNKLNTTTILKEIVSNKPIMIKANAPRFLRQGDTVNLIASLQNATDSLQHCSAEIELFNPVDNTIYATKNFNFEINEMGTETISIEYLVPDSLMVLAMRAKASNGIHSDGEQVLIPILTNSSQVIESTPFYIEKGKDFKEIVLPKFTNNTNITLEYCDNPMWYIAGSLPVINSNDNTTATQIAHSIFAHLVADKVTKSYPQILDAIKYWKENPQDSALVSILAKNSELQISNLLASPFLKDSKEQTLRLSQLAQLFDESKNKKTISNLTEKLREHQQNDGGFAWYKYPGAMSSIYTTSSILSIIGKAKSLGTEIDNDLNKIIENAIKYLDNAVFEQYNKQQNKHSYTRYLSYAYTRSLFLDIPMNVTINDLFNNIIKSLSKEWKRMDLSNKALCAITLANSNHAESAKPIMKSINQFSIYKPSEGRFWNNPNDKWSFYSNKLALTSLILQAYNAVTPNSPHIDQIKQWILLDKQTNDWGNSSMAAEAVYAYLSFGNTPLTTTPFPEFTINNKPLTFNTIDKILGYGKMELNITKTKNNILSIKRKSNVSAWGAVYSRYIAPLKDIKSASVPTLSIKKKIENLSSTTDTINVGDKVRITLTITNSRNLEYVTLTDQRAACLEPVEQISGYRAQDLLGYYLDIKDTQTNMFLNFIPKGTHIITYDAYVTNSGNFSNGIATIQCQYAPQIVAHTAGSDFNVK